jgi:phosphoadenosine phosphosulfate reductase
MLSLLYKLNINIPVVWVRFSDRYNPDCVLVRDAFLSSHFINYHEEVFDYKKVRKGDKHWIAIAEKYSPYRITGIRNDESKKRLIQYFVSGHASKNSCRPLALWKSSEIFAYIEQNKLPLCPVYGYLGGGRWDRSRIRTHSIAGTTANGIGRTEWEKEYYSDLLRRIENHVVY